MYYNNRCPALTCVQRGTFLETDTSAIKSDKVFLDKTDALIKADPVTVRVLNSYEQAIGTGIRRKITF